MSHREFVEWGVFYRAFPFCDERTADRPAALVATAVLGSKGSSVEIDDLLPYPIDDSGADASAEAADVMGYLRGTKQND